MKKRIADYIGEVCFWYLKRHMPQRLDDYLNKRGREVAQETATKVSMAYLHKQGFLTCAVCPQRFGLQGADIDMNGEKRHVLLCMAHYKQAMEQQGSKLSEATV